MSSMLIAVPVYGRPEDTHAFVADLQRQAAEFLIVDDRGTAPGSATSV